MAKGTLVLGLTLAALAVSRACIFKYGSSQDSLAAHTNATLWNHGFLGDDWVGVDAAGKPWVCKSGSRQSPINIPSASVSTHVGPVIPALRTRLNYSDLVSNGSNVEVINNGHTIQIEWLYDYASDVRIATPAKPSPRTTVTAVLDMTAKDNATYVRAVPIQFHFHSHSEHMIHGRHYPLELHIVHQVTGLPGCNPSCFSVVGVLFELTDEPDNPDLEPIWARMPMHEGEKVFLPAGTRIRLERLLPSASQRDYVTYEGSLTTPPCSEGLLWHVLAHPRKISHNQWRKYLNAVAFKDCELLAHPGNETTTATDSTTHEHGHHHHRRRRNLLGGRRGLLATSTKEVTGNGSGSSSTEEHHPEDYNCTAVAYGFNYRLVQPINGRTIKYAPTH